jgi:hypothetical protein
MKTLLLSLSLLFVGCTENSRSAHFGGNKTVNLPAGQKFVTATWKISESNTSLWYITRPMREGEVAETFLFQENSSFGMLEGQVTFKESR